MRRGLIAGLALLAATTTPLAAQKIAVPGVSPANPLAIISIPSTGAALRELESNPAAAAWLKARAAALLPAGPDSIGSRLGEASTTVGFDLNPLSMLTTSLDGLDLYVVEQNKIDNFVAVLDFNGKGKSSALIELLRGEAAKSSGVSGGFPATTVIERPITNGRTIFFPAFEIYLAELNEEILVYSTNQPALESAVANEGAVLFESAYFKRFAPGIEKEPGTAWAFGDLSHVQLLVAGLIDVAPGALGDATSPVAAKLNATPTMLKLTTYVPMEDMVTETKRYAMTAPPAGSIVALNHAPLRSLATYATGHFDGLAFYDFVLNEMDRIPGREGTKAKIDAALTKNRAELGFDPRTDFLAVMGPELVVYTTNFTPTNAANFFAPGSEVGLVSWVRDPDRFAKVLRLLEEKISPPPAPPKDKNSPPPTPINPITRESFAGLTIKSVSNPPMAWAYHEGRFMMATSVDTLKEGITAGSDAETALPTLTDLEEALKSVDATRSSLLVVVPDRFLSPMLPEGSAPRTLLDASSLVVVSTTYRPDGRRQEFVLLPKK